MSKFYLPILGLFVATLLIVSCKTDPPAPRSNKLNIRLEAAVDKVNPLAKGPAYMRYVANHVFQTLGSFNPKTIELEPLMVKALPEAVLVNEGKYKGMYAYTFELRDEAKWDNGTPITAADVIFSYKMILSPAVGSVFTPYLEDLKDVEVDPSNPKKFTAYLGTYYFLGLESLCQMPIFPKYNYDPQGALDNIAIADLADPKKRDLLNKQDGPLQAHATNFLGAAMSSDLKNITGSGAYRPVFLDEAQGVILARKPDWWGNGLSATYPSIAAYPDTLHFKLVKQEDAAINMLRSGELDVTSNISPANYKKLEADNTINDKFDFSLQWAAIYNRVMLNNSDPILSDKKIRQALAYGVDYDYLLNDIQMGMAQRTVGPVFPGHAIYAKSLTPYQFNVEKAKALLAEAGWTDSDGDGVADKTIGGKKTPLELELVNTSGTGVSDLISAALQSSLAKIGVKVKLRIVDINKIAEETRKGNFQMAATASSAHPGEFDLSQSYHTKYFAPNGDNRMHYSNPKFDEVIDKIKITQDKTVRQGLFQEAQALLHEDVPEVFLYSPGFRLVTSKQFEFQKTPMRPGYMEALSKLKK